MAGNTAEDLPDEPSASLGRRVWRVAKRGVLGIMWFAIVMAYGGALNLPNRVPGFTMFWIGFLMAAVGWWLVVWVHEVGHALGARIAGWRVMSFVVLPIAIRPRPFGVAWMSKTRVHDAGGWVLSVPSSRDVMTRTRDAVSIAGGPAASLVLAAITLPIGIAWSAQMSMGSIVQGVPTWGLLLGALGYQSVLAALVTLLPSSSAQSTTDGDKLRALWRDPPLDPGLHALGLLMSMDRHEVRLRDHPQWLIDLARQTQPPIDELPKALDCIEISVALDAAAVDVARARRLLEAYRMTHGDSEWRATCDAWLAAAHEGDLKRAHAVTWTGPLNENDDQAGLKLAVAAAIAARSGKVADVEPLLHSMRRERARTRKINNRYFRDAVFDDLGARVRALAAPPA